MTLQKTEEFSSILIISEDPEMTEVWEGLFQQRNCYVVSETCARTGIQSARILTPDLIILDLDLPKSERISLCEELRPTTNGALVLLAPRETDCEIFDDYYHAGVDEHLVTPISPMILLIKSIAWLVRQEWVIPRTTFPI
jgi:DNA-binding response OmpR family regulator